MDKTEEFYNAIGSDFQSVAKRFGNNSAILTRFVLKFLSDQILCAFNHFLIFPRRNRF